jgi:hypothetical protein
MEVPMTLAMRARCKRDRYPTHCAEISAKLVKRTCSPNWEFKIEFYLLDSSKRVIVKVFAGKQARDLKVGSYKQGASEIIYPASFFLRLNGRA